MSDDNPYAVLGVAETASPIVIRAAFRALSKQYHPDASPTPDAERMKEINDAWSRLKTEEVRAETNEALSAQRTRAVIESAPSGNAGWGAEGWSAAPSDDAGWTDENWSDPPSPRYQVGNEQSDWLALAKDHLANGDAARASYAAREATQQQGADAEAWATRARANLMLGRQSEALYELSQAIELRPDVAGYHFELGNVHASSQHWAQALESYESAATADPRVTMYRAAMGNVHVWNDAPETGLPLLEQACLEQPDNEAFQDMTARALNNSAVGRWTPLRNGERVITTQEQGEYTRDALDRAVSLRSHDVELRSLLERNLSKADQALSRTWAYSREDTARACLVSSLLCILIGQLHPLLGFLALAVVCWAFWTFGRKPGWKVRDRQTRHLQLS